MKIVGIMTKVLLVSLLVSWAIKYLGPDLEFAPTALNALIGISIPPLVIALLLIWQMRLGRESR